MNIVSSNMTVSDYCHTMERGEITVNTDYQRSDKVWPTAAQSFLIETILLGFPIPKLSLHQVTDIRTRRTFKQIVDGQQRSKAIRSFFEGRLRLGRLDLETASGKTYAQLDDDLQQRFLDYGLSLDIFVGAAPEEVREVFRRMNSYTVPLNPEEQRHATYQGEFKWFIHRLTKHYDAAFIGMGLYSEKQLVRMADTKLLTEVCHALLFGISTTNKKKLDDLYRAKDPESSFPEELDLRSRLMLSLDRLIQWSDIHETALMKPFIMYSLLLALTHTNGPVAILQREYDIFGPIPVDDTRAVENLTALAEALDNPDSAGRLLPFVEASSSRTNVASQRAVRFRWLCEALSGRLS